MSKELISFSYHGEPARKMTKAQAKKYAEHRKACEEVFKGLCDTHVFDGDETDKAKLDTLIEMCCDIQHEICWRADKIKEHHKTVSKNVSKSITSQMFKDAVNLLKNQLATLSDTSAIEAKIEKDFVSDVYRQSFKRSLYKHYLTFGQIVLPEEKSVEVQKMPSISTKTDKQFTQELKNAAKLRDKMDNELYPEYRHYAMAAEHLTHGDLDYAKFKSIVDYHYYAEFKNPEEKWYDHSPQCIIDKILNAYKLCDKYGYEDLFASVKDYFYEKFLQEQNQEQNEKEVA